MIKIPASLSRSRSQTSVVVVAATAAMMQLNELFLFLSKIPLLIRFE
jgi:hypothetical protein